MGRLILVSNRLPVTLRWERGVPEIVASAGGLATGLKGHHERSRGLWIGWAGSGRSPSRAGDGKLARRLAEKGLVGIPLSRTEVAHFYEGFSNGVLWPLLHYFLDRIPLDTRGWDVYRRVNAKFADAVVAAYRPGDAIWVHDYHLMLLPALLRKRLPDARIGFFLHTPFPSAEVFAILPWRAEILRGLLGADLIGFHTVSYMRNYAQSLLRATGIEADVDRVLHEGREVVLGAFPIGIDGPGFRALAGDAKILRERDAIRSRHEGCRLLLGVDRLDYTKGIPRRLTAVGRLLERQPRWRGKVTLIQVAVPSREKVPEYERLRSEVDELVGRLNGTFGTVSWVPVQHVCRNFTERQLAALYAAADAMLVTPLRDGMNLVAKEFAAIRADEDGVLVLSELTGAASELGAALQVNPYDIDGLATAMDRALTMPRAERRKRMRALRERVFAQDVHWWAAAFLAALEATASSTAKPSSRAVLAAARRSMAAAARLVLVLDYDGTLVGFGPNPEGLPPDPELLELLRALAARPGTDVHIVSGRPRETLEPLFDGLQVGLHAEHGLWSRMSPEGGWRELVAVSTEWWERARPILDIFVARTPGSLVEEKSASLAWHYRQSDPEFGALQANRLRQHLGDLLRNAPVQVLPGDRIVELRHHAVQKGLVVAAIKEVVGPDATFAAFGDDVTDEDLFAALPADGITVHVGSGRSRAALRVTDPGAARALLASLLRPSPSTKGAGDEPPKAGRPRTGARIRPSRAAGPGSR